MKPNTHITLSEGDRNEFIMVSNTSVLAAKNFSYKELYNSKTGLSEHPISRQAVNCVQIVRDFFGTAIKVNSTYRNYVPTGAGVVGAVSKSPHMIACAIDFKFVGNQELRDNLLMQARDDFANKGELFQLLYDAGCSGFGVYDTFIHLDTAHIEEYDFMRAKRTATYQGRKYASWNKQQVLRLKSPTFITETDGTTIAVTPSMPAPVVAVTDQIKETAGVITGIFAAVSEDEDRFQDIGKRNIVPIILASISGLAFLAFLALSIKRLLS